MPRLPERIDLPCPGVRFDAGLLARVERLVARLAAARERREGAGAARIARTGSDFVGHRPYQRGEDLRLFDWSLWARLERPYVRVLRREAGERWTIAVDASASMGVGPPGKLQRAAEVALALAALGLRARAEVHVFAGAHPPLRVRRARGLSELASRLEGLRAEGARAHEGLERDARGLASSGRVFVVGDLGPSPRAAIARLARPRAELTAVQLLAPHELAPAPLGALEWADPESGARLVLEVDPTAVASYGVELARDLEAARAAAAAHRVRYGCFSTALPFEDVLARLAIA